MATGNTKHKARSESAERARAVAWHEPRCYDFKDDPADVQDLWVRLMLVCAGQKAEVDQ